MELVSKEVTQTIHYFVDGNFEWEIHDLYETLEALADDSRYIKVTAPKLEEYLINKGVIVKYMRHHNTTDKFDTFFTEVSNLYPTD